MTPPAFPAPPTETCNVRPSSPLIQIVDVTPSASASRHNFVNAAGGYIGDVELSARVFAKRGGTIECKSAGSRRKKLRSDILKIRSRRAVVIQGKNLAGQIIT